MKEKTLTKIQESSQKLDYVNKKNTSGILSETDNNSNSEQKIVTLSDKYECIQCKYEIIKTINSGHEYDIHQSVCNDCKKDFWLTEGSLTDCLKKKELSKINITDFLLFA